MKKLLLIALTLASSTALAYKINVQNDTDYVLTVHPNFAAGIKKYEWVIQPRSNFFNETHAYCTKSLKFDAKNPANENEVIKGLEYKPKSTGAGIRCADLKVVVSAQEVTDGKELQVTSHDEKVATKK